MLIRRKVQRVASLTKIGFIGKKIDDIMLYFSRVLVKLDKKVAIVDASFQQNLKYAIPQINENLEVITYRNTDVYVNCYTPEVFAKVDFSKYEFVFINFGLNKYLLNEFFDCHEKFVLTDMENHSIYKLKEFLSNFNKQIEMIRVYRDVIDCKISKKYLDNLLDVATIKYSKEYGLYLSENEMLCRIESQYNDIFKFNKLPKDFKAMIMEVLISFGFDKKLVIKALKAAERGG